jgi:hypothetical protein
MPTPAPNYIHPHTFPTAWPDVLPNGIHYDAPIATLARGFGGYILTGVARIGLDVFAVVVPFLIGLTVLYYLVSKIGARLDLMSDAYDEQQYGVGLDARIAVDRANHPRDWR